MVCVGIAFGNNVITSRNRFVVDMFVVSLLGSIQLEFASKAAKGIPLSLLWSSMPIEADGWLVWCKLCLLGSTGPVIVGVPLMHDV